MKNAYQLLAIPVMLLCFTFLTSCGPEEGCTCFQSSNYDSEAEEDDGSCLGCTNPSADNYNSCAEVSDGDCEFGGCTDPSAINYDPSANVNDGSCIAAVFGCTDSTAPNYNPLANSDDGSCLPPILGCTDPGAANYDPDATLDDGSCVDGEFLILTNLNVDGEPDLVTSERRVTLLFQVTKQDGSGKTDLKTDAPSDFELFESQTNSVASLQNITTEADPNWRPGPAIPFEILTVILIDISSSVEPNIEDIKAAVKLFIESKQTEQKIAIYTFNEAETLIIDFTSDTEQLIAALDLIPVSGLSGFTNLWGAINNVSNTWTDAFSIDGITDGSLIVFTDGAHNFGVTSELSATGARDNLNGRRVFVVGVETDDFLTNGGKEDIENLLLNSFETNFFPAGNFSELGSRFQEVQDRISSLANSIYFLDYVSTKGTPSENTFIEIRVTGNLNTGSTGKIQTSFLSFGPP